MESFTPLTCLKSDRRAKEIHTANRNLIISDESTQIFLTREKKSEDESTKSFCYFKCDLASGELSPIGNGAPDPTMIPNCMVQKIKTSALSTTTRNIYYFIHCKGLSHGAVRQLVLTEELLNQSYAAGRWNRFVELKLRSIYNSFGWLELMKWAHVYKQNFELENSWFKLVTS